MVNVIELLTEPAVLGVLGGIVGGVASRIIGDMASYRLKKRRNKFDWYENVQRTAAGILWEVKHSDGRSEDEVADFVEELKHYRRHQYATVEMVQQMAAMIEAWSDYATSDRTLSPSLRMRTTVCREAEDLYKETETEQKTKFQRIYVNAKRFVVDRAYRGLQRGDPRVSSACPHEYYRNLLGRISYGDFCLFTQGQAYLCDNDDDAYRYEYYEPDEQELYWCRLDKFGDDIYLRINDPQLVPHPPIQSFIYTGPVERRTELQSLPSQQVFTAESLINSCGDVSELSERVWDVEEVVRVAGGTERWVGELDGLEEWLNGSDQTETDQATE
ncbi:hypothetical protein [Halomarina pelagica]|uniref:hypothetical protein n=1 Tax=Halomarina pelagica TaxID=2961599 RepID=UPI0020C55BB9|nr:hypothetical protein [Halomarina sp. BND7]